MISGKNGSDKKYASSKAGATKGTSKTLSGPAMYTKVNQATIDKIKKMGMTAALKSAPTANAEMVQGLRRMYGADRVKAAMGSAKTTGLAQKITPEKGAGFKKTSPYAFSGTKNPSKRPSNAPGAISNKSKSNAPSAISNKKVSTSSTTSTSTTKKSTNKNLKPGSLAYNIANNKGIFGNKK